WTQYPDEKSDQPKATWKGTASIDKETGEYKYQAEGGPTIIERADRSKKTINLDNSTAEESPDGSKVIRDADKNVTDIVYPHRPGEKERESRHFDYDKDGNVVGVRNKDGTYWAKDPKSDVWTQYKDETRQEITGQTWKGTAQVNKDTGEYT